MTTEQRLQQLEDRIAIRELIDAYTYCADTRNIQGHMALFTEDTNFEVYMDEKIEQYIIDIVFATRYPDQYRLSNYKNLISFGASPRASINLALASKAYAFIKRRGYVIPEDVRAICHDVLRHRIGLTYEAEAENMTTEDIVTGILNAIEVP